MKRWLAAIGILVGLGGAAQGSPLPIRWKPSRTIASVPAQPSKRDVLAKLKVLQDKQISDSSELETAIRKQLNEMMHFELGGDDLQIDGRRTNLVTKKIEELNKRRNELNARREIVDRLIFQIDSKWDGKSKLQDFLSQTFIEMASTDLSDGRDNRLWKEFTYLSMVMREVPEPNEDMIALFEGYLNSGSVLEPKTPAEFLATRNYTNGLESEQAHVVDREFVGDGLTAPAEPATHPAQLASQKIANSPLETAEKAQLDSGQVPMSATHAAGKADSPDAAPLAAAPSRAATTTSATSQSAADLAAHGEETKPALDENGAAPSAAAVPASPAPAPASAAKPNND